MVSGRALQPQSGVPMMIPQVAYFWIFQYFQGIHLVKMNSNQIVVNLRSQRSFILEFLLTSCQKYYL